LTCAAQLARIGSMPITLHLDGHPMDDNFFLSFFLGLVLGAALSVPLSIAITTAERHALEATAIEAGAAEWTIDPKTGVRTWKWTPATPKQPAP